jgi:hypothetical protein
MLKYIVISVLMQGGAPVDIQGLKNTMTAKQTFFSTKEDCEASLYKVFLKEESEGIRFERTEKGNVMLISEYSEMLKKYVAYAQCVPLTIDNK